MAGTQATRGAYREQFYPGTEELAADEMRITAPGTGRPFLRRFAGMSIILRPGVRKPNIRPTVQHGARQRAGADAAFEKIPIRANRRSPWPACPCFPWCRTC